MPQIFKIGSYVIYFQPNEGDPIEPTYIHVSEGVSLKMLLKYGLRKLGGAFYVTTIPIFLKGNCVTLWILSKHAIQILKKNGINILNNYIIIADTPDTPTPPRQLYQLGFRFVRLRLWGYR